MKLPLVQTRDGGRWHITYVRRPVTLCGRAVPADAPGRDDTLDIFERLIRDGRGCRACFCALAAGAEP